MLTKKISTVQSASDLADGSPVSPSFEKRRLKEFLPEANPTSGAGGRRHFSAPKLTSPVAGSLPAAGPESTTSKLSMPNSRRLWGNGAGHSEVEKEERIAGWPTPTHTMQSSDSPNVRQAMRSSSTPSGARDRKNVEVKAQTTGPVRAVEFDKRFQAQLLEHWKRECEVEDVAGRVQRRQLILFFDFLKDERGELDLSSGASEFLPQAMADMEALEVELRRAPPDPDFAQVMEFNPRQNKALRQVLGMYSQISRPSNIVPHGLGQEVLYRPTFCRFILDSNLVQIENETEKPPYHRSVRLFDAVSKVSKDGSQRYALIDQCVSIISQLLGQTDLPTNLAWQSFEAGLEKAENTAKALVNECKQRAKDCAEAAEKECTDEAVLERRMEMFGKHGSPPHFFNGSLRDWSRGLRFWVDSLNTQCTPECTAERVEQSYALERYLKDTLVEPGFLHATLKFSYLFRELYVAYCDQERHRITQEEAGYGTRKMKVPHMSFAAFFRFCLDFSIFPDLASFDEAWLAYREAESVVVLGTEDSPVRDKLKKAVSRLTFALKQNTTKSLADRLLKNVKSNCTAPDENSEDSRSPCRSGSGSQSGEDMDDNEDMLPPRPGIGNQKSSTQSSKAMLAAAERAGSGGSSAAALRPRRLSNGGIATVGVPVERNNSKEVPPSAARQSRRPSLLKGGSETQAASSAAERIRDSFVQAPGGGPPAKRRMSLEEDSKEKDKDKTTKDTGKEEQMPAVAAAAEKRRVKVQDVDDDAPKETRSKKEKDKDRDKDSAKDPALDHETEEDEVPPRIKPCPDFSWISKPFEGMTHEELDAYSLLHAIGQCCTDHFLNVRGLFTATKQFGDKQGFISPARVIITFRTLRIVHAFNAENSMQEFIRMVDPLGNGLLDPSELEKAVNAERADEIRRWPYLAKAKQIDVGGVSSVTLAEEARRLSALPCEVDETTGQEVALSFGAAAFTECLMLLCSKHMHGSGVPIKAGALGGVKGMWLVSFLHHHFDEMAKVQGDVAKKAQDDPFEAARHGLPTQGASGKQEDQAEEIPPVSAHYQTVSAALLEKIPELFTRCLNPDEEVPMVEPWASESQKRCSHCKRQRSKRGLGSVFCHVCSCVDSQPLLENLLYPVIERSRLRRQLAAAQKVHARKDSAAPSMPGSQVQTPAHRQGQSFLEPAA